MSIRDDIEKVDKKVKNVEQSIAWDMLQDAKKTNKRMFILIIVILCMWLATIGAFLYYISTTGYEENYREQTVEDLKDTNGLEIINGDTYGNSKTSKKN